MNDATKPQDSKGAKATVRYVDWPECGETFADSINSVFFDGQTMRIEFGITRMDDMKKDQPLTGRRYPACRPPSTSSTRCSRPPRPCSSRES
jgi:hypothetical protein